MRGKGSGFGMLMLVIVLVIVMLLVAKNWQAVAPTALDVHEVGTGTGVADHGETGAGEEVRSGNLPRLGEMKQATDAHAEQVQDTLEQID